MAQLKDSVIDGNLEVAGDIILKTNNNAVQGVHPDTGEITNMLHMSNYGNTVLGYDGYAQSNGNSNIYGNDIMHYVASAGKVDYRPYYRAADAIDFKVRTSGYVTNSGKNVVFTIPITKPVIGNPTATVTSSNGFVLRQNNTYTHGSAASTYVKPTSYTIDSNYNSGFIVTAVFDITTNVINNAPIGIFWDGKITLS